MARPLESAARGPHLLMSTANKQDRFKLINDPNVPQPNIDIPIHPIFGPWNFTNAAPDTYQKLQQALRLASMFLEYDSVLEWFVAPLLGLPLLDSLSGKTYLSDPLANKSKFEKGKLTDMVRRALDCLSHSVTFRFLTNSEVKFYARTTINDRRPLHKFTCTQHFRTPKSVKIELRKQYYDFLQDHYTSSSFCDVLRHDFSLAVSLVHEVCHAVGVMRRNDLNEPWIRLEHLDEPEFGYAWEDFMFGGIINPFDRTSSTISFLMRKIWATDATAYAAGGKEWSAVPMSYIAQWFQKDTWNLIAVHGPTAIPPPTVQLKLRADKHRYIVMSDNYDALNDVRELQAELIEQYKGNAKFPGPAVAIITAKLWQTHSQKLQKYNLQSPSRTAGSNPACGIVTRSRKASADTIIRSYSDTLLASKTRTSAALPRSKSPLKRGADVDEEKDLPKELRYCRKKRRIRY
jgi:hypothetical protein